MRPAIIVILIRAGTQGRFKPLDRGEDRVLGNRLLLGPQLLVLVTWGSVLRLSTPERG